jgi:putative ABC transport system ATP-binding protein
MVEIDSLVFSYGIGNFRLTVPSLSIQPHEKLAIIGPSGSGKTSLLKLISGILVPQQGQILINGVSVNSLSDANRRDFRISDIGFIFQNFELLDYLDAFDNILHPYRISSALKLTSEIRNRAYDLAHELGIQHKLKHPSSTLSQGEQQRTAICRALLPTPKIILADEATGNLDPSNKTKILEALFRCTDKNHATLIAVTHDHELLSHFDRVIDFKDYCLPEETSND